MTDIQKDSPGYRFYMRHLDYFFNKDVEGLVANDYTEDAQVLAGEFAVKGPEALKQLFTGYLDMIGDFKLRSTEKFCESDDAIILEATLDTEKTGERKVYDCFVMRDGKIAYHFTGVR
jgi:ketosteroid isomerase-like protein